MLAAEGVNWTNVFVALIAGVPAIIAAIFAGVAGITARRNARALHVPSGGTIGQGVDRVMSKTAGTSAGVTALVRAHGAEAEAEKILNGDADKAT